MWYWVACSVLALPLFIKLIIQIRRDLRRDMPNVFGLLSDFGSVVCVVYLGPFIVFGGVGLGMVLLRLFVDGANSVGVLTGVGGYPLPPLSLP